MNAFRAALLECFADDFAVVVRELAGVAERYRRADPAARSVVWKGRLMTAAFGVSALIDDWRLFGVGVLDLRIGRLPPALMELVLAAVSWTSLYNAEGRREADYKAASKRLTRAAENALSASEE